MLQRETEQVSAFCRMQGVPAVAYHGGMNSKSRKDVETKFRSGSIRYQHKNIHIIQRQSQQLHYVVKPILQINNITPPTTTTYNNNITHTHNNNNNNNSNITPQTTTTYNNHIQQP